MTKSERPRPGDESGSALVLALLVVLTVGTGLAIALDYTGVGLTLAPSVKNERNKSNYVQGAVEGAINQIRGSSNAGRTDTACPPFTPPVPSAAELPGVGGQVVTVTCSGKDAGSEALADQPRFVIHALGLAPEGIRHVGTAELYIDGGIYSQGVVDVAKPGGSLRVNGSIAAVGGCTSGNITSTDPLDQTCPPLPAPAGDDPNYVSAIADGAALASLINTADVTTGADPIPSCATSGRVTFAPGYYSETPAVLAQRLPRSCDAVLWHFLPGRYYFDYSGVWDIGDHQVVGGTPSSTPTVLDKACTESQPGVQFVFGGSSQVTTSSSTKDYGMALCGPSPTETVTGSPQRIVTYGVKSGSTPADQSVVLRGGLTAPTPSAGFPLPAAARVINGVFSPAVFLGSTSAVLNYGQLPSDGLPKGARVTDVRLRLNHTVTNATVQVSLSAPGMPAPVIVDPALTCGPAPAYCTSATNLAGQFSGDVLWRLLSRLSATYTATPGSDKKKDPDVQVDGLEIVVTYTAPALRKLDCGASCVFFTSTTNPNVFMRGTVYTPTSSWAVKVHNKGDTIFNRGIIMRDIAIDLSDSSKQDSSPFQLPRGIPNGRLVLFQGYISGVEKVRACARYTDFVRAADGTTSAYAGWSLTVPRWSVLRAPGGTASCA